MLHNTTREKLLQTGNGYVALVIDAAYYMGWREYDTFRAQELMGLLSNFGLSSKVIYIALRHDAFRRSGRRNGLYCLPAPSTVRKAIQVVSEDSTRDQLDETAFTSLKAYRMALHRALLIRKPRPGFRAMLARRIGVCKNTTRNYERAMNVRVTNQYRYTPLDEKTLDEMPDNPPPPSKRFLFIKHDKKPFFASYSKAIALYWLLKKVPVQVVEQVGSLYEVFPGSGNSDNMGWGDFAIS